MNRIRIALVLWSLAQAGAALAGTPDIPDEINAKLARAKSQIGTDAAARTSGALAGITAIGSAGGNGAAGNALGKGCNIAIGNVFEDNKNKISTSAKRETTVIVTGDVIQVGNNCR